MKKLIYLLGITTGLIVMLYGLKSIDNTIHSVARVGAGLVLLSSHAIILLLVVQELIAKQSYIIEHKQMMCDHKFKYVSIDCPCLKCGIMKSKVETNVKKGD